MVQLHLPTSKDGAATFYYVLGWCSYILLYQGMVQLNFIIFVSGLATFFILGAGATTFFYVLSWYIYILLYLGQCSYILLYFGLMRPHLLYLGWCSSILLYLRLVQLYFSILWACASTFYYFRGCCSYILPYLGWCG